MSDIHQWNVNIMGDVVATIESGQWYTGPYAPGELVELASISVKNTGDQTGDLIGQSFFWPGESNEQKNTKSTKYDIQPGGIWDYHPAATIPLNAPPGILPVGVKVWGETEDEPGWTLGNIVVESLPPYALPTLLLGGLLVAGYLITKK